MKKKEWLILCIIAIVAGIALALTNMVTKGPIEQQAVAAANAARIAVFADADNFAPQELAEGAALDDLYAATKGEEIVGYVGSATVQGFGGPIAVTLGVKADGTVTGISVGGSQFAETSGLGSRTKDPEFTDQFFAGSMTAEPALGENVEAISGATISSRAVTGGAAKIYSYVMATVSGEDPTASSDNGVVTILDTPDENGAVKLVCETVTGFGGEFEVTVGMDAEGKIVSLDVGGASFNETDGLGARAKEDDFRAQFIGQSGVLEYGNGVDAISGATITSNAVLEGVNAALANTATESTPVSEQAEPAATEEPAVTMEPIDGKTVTVKGFGGDIDVTVATNDDGSIKAVQVGGANFNETDGLGAKAKDAAFLDQFVGATAPVAYGDGIEAISGATITSTAVLDAINVALTGDEPAATEETATAEPIDGKTVTVKGFGGDIDVTVATNDDGSIKAVQVGGANFNETDGLGAKAKDAAFLDQFVGATAPVAYGDGIEAISGATITSTAVLDAINVALTGDEPAATEEPATAEPIDGKTVTVKGFGGDIDVTVTTNDDGSIKAVEVGGANFNETDGLGAKAKDAAFLDQFVGATAPVAYGDGIEAISGATITSTAVLDAINEALAGDAPAVQSEEKTEAVVSAAPEATAEATATATEAPTAVATATEAPAATDAPTATKAPEATAEAAATEEPVTNAKTVTVKGFGGDIDVTVTTNDDGSIKAVQVGGANFNETDGLGAKAKDAAFLDQFVGAAAPVAYGDGIEAISGATITSTAVLDAINEALAGDEGNAKTVTVKGFGGDIDVTVTTNDDGSIKAVEVGGANFNETDGLGAKAKDAAFLDQFVGATAPVAYGDGIEAISGATITSTAVLDAINEALTK